MAVRRRLKHMGGLSLWPKGYSPALSVVYSTTAAAAAACGNMQVLCLYLHLFTFNITTG